MIKEPGGGTSDGIDYGVGLDKDEGPGVGTDDGL